jgi:hypothetical protein
MQLDRPWHVSQTGLVPMMRRSLSTSLDLVLDEGLSPSVIFVLKHAHLGFLSPALVHKRHFAS